MPRLSLSPLRRLLDELVKFGLVGTVGFVVDVGVFNLLRWDAGPLPAPLADRPVTAKVISVSVATAVTYLGNRHWTWRHRARLGTSREVVTFFALNGVGMAIAVACLAVSHYVLGFTSALADNISGNVVGLALGTLFRFWSYRRFVFIAPLDTAADARSRLAPSISEAGGTDVSKRRP